MYYDPTSCLLVDEATEERRVSELRVVNNGHIAGYK